SPFRTFTPHIGKTQGCTAGWHLRSGGKHAVEGGIEDRGGTARSAPDAHLERRPSLRERKCSSPRAQHLGDRSTDRVAGSVSSPNPATAEAQRDHIYPGHGRMDRWRTPGREFP